MSRLRVPRYIQWIVFTGLIFLFLMTILRCVSLFVFERGSHSSAELTDGLILGLRYDLRMVCIACLFFLLLGTIPALHPLNRKTGKTISFFIWIILIIAFALFYTVDFA